jgi:hypothetical protein
VVAAKFPRRSLPLLPLPQQKQTVLLQPTHSLENIIDNPEGSHWNSDFLGAETEKPPRDVPRSRINPWEKAGKVVGKCRF